MTRISQIGYLFIQTGVLCEGQIINCLNGAITEFNKTFNKDIPQNQFYLNLVTNKEGKSFGYAYAYIDDKELFNIIVGKNLDGSERVELIDDPDWEPPSDDETEALEAAGDDWGELCEVEKSYECPKIIQKLDPLITLPGIKYTESQLKQVLKDPDLARVQKENLQKYPFGFLEVSEVSLSEKKENLNSIFSKNLPDWVTEDFLFKFFSRFNRDPLIRTKKDKSKFEYPVVKIKKYREGLGEVKNCSITFSPSYPHTSSFLIKLIKRIEVERKGKKEMLFFSQAKKRLSE